MTKPVVILGECFKTLGRSEILSVLCFSGGKQLQGMSLCSENLIVNEALDELENDISITDCSIVASSYMGFIDDHELFLRKHFVILCITARSEDEVEELRSLILRPASLNDLFQAKLLNFLSHSIV
jgi:hypothetical protein